MPTKAEAEVFRFVAACPTCEAAQDQPCISNLWHVENRGEVPCPYATGYIHSARRDAALRAFGLDRLPSDIED